MLENATRQSAPKRETEMTRKALAKVKLLILDVDGVLTDGRIIINDQGDETKHFNAKDGHGLRMLMQAGVEVALISGRRSGAAEFRARDLGITEVHMGVKDKSGVCAALVQRKKLGKAEICCIGDDLPDLPLFEQAGIAIAVADAVSEIRAAAAFSTKSRGGKGAVREICEAILKSKGLWPYSIRKDGKLDFTL
ncbi:MAG: 3-deoxy-D-manno-octulosonate 8-phosphate phosphatase, YrbI family [Deltaproteobacteria bacterium]|nr:3-deoxy-D-manno-octulosonate 8-phosphate phosphatase, YrbI family [Deltaproteobacteria bacterium]